MFLRHLFSWNSEFHNFAVVLVVTERVDAFQLKFCVRASAVIGEVDRVVNRERGIVILITKNSHKI